MNDLSTRDPDQMARLARLALVAGVAYLLFQTFNPFLTPIARPPCWPTVSIPSSGASSAP